jgi:hypothetical protein
MAVYVDNAAIPYGLMKMCHMVADTAQELHEMANKLGIKFEHYHNYHYNICQSKRRKAIELGAVKITFRQAVLVRRELAKKEASPVCAITLPYANGTPQES